jgi:uncharacterized phage protein (TIGR02220 family)
MDKLQWFKFTPSDWMMGKIQKCPAETRGMFINLCCLYWNKECELSFEDAEIEVDEEHLSILIKKKIVTVDDENIRISFLDEQMEGILETSDKRRDAANKRWGKKSAKAMQVDASALKNDANAMQNDADKSKSKIRVEKTKKDIETIPTAKALDFSNLLLFINKTFGRSFQAINTAVQAKYKARLKEGYTSEDIRAAMLNCKKDPHHIETNYKYCTPEFFSRADKIDLHSNQGKPEQSSDPMVNYVKQHIEKYGNS